MYKKFRDFGDRRAEVDFNGHQSKESYEIRFVFFFNKIRVTSTYSWLQLNVKIDLIVQEASECLKQLRGK